MRVRELMTEGVITIGEDASLAESVDMMLRNEVGSIIVVNTENLPAGIVTETDVLTIGHELDEPFSSIPIADAMTEDIVTVEPGITVRDAVERMNEHDVKKLPVVEKFRLVGIVTMTDVIREYATIVSETYRGAGRRSTWSDDD